MRVVDSPDAAKREAASFVGETDGDDEDADNDDDGAEPFDSFNTPLALVVCNTFD